MRKAGHRRLAASLSRRRVAVAVAAAAGAAFALSACTATPVPNVTMTPVDASGSPLPPVQAGSASPSYADHMPQVVSTTSLVATSKRQSIEVFAEPEGEESQTVSAEDVLTAPEATPLVFLVKDSAPGWYEVYLPVRPNGSTGWVHEDDVNVQSTNFRVEVSLQSFELRIYEGRELVLETDIGVGRSERPTPGGTYYVRELLQPPDPGGVYGPYAYGLSGYSPVLDSFNGGNAIIGMHGTNNPDSFGRYVSSGCIRIPNDVITQMVNEVGLPLGVPVYISDNAAPLTTTS